MSSGRCCLTTLGLLLVLGCAKPVSETEKQAANTPVTESQLLKTVQKLGGRVTRDDKDPNKPVVQVALSDSKVTDDDLVGLSLLKHLQSLDLARTNVTDAALKQLAGLEELRTLDIRGTKVTDAGLKELSTLKKLRTLDLPTRITDAGLKELAPLNELGELWLAYSQVTGLAAR